MLLDWNGEDVQIHDCKSFNLSKELKANKFSFKFEDDNEYQNAVTAMKGKHHCHQQQRHFGRFMRQKAAGFGVKKGHKGLGRKCPLCSSHQAHSTHLRRHLMKHCPVQIFQSGLELEQLLQQASKTARINRYQTIISPTSSPLINNPHPPSVTVNVNNASVPHVANVLSDQQDRAENPSVIQPKYPVDHYFMEFRKSFKNPLSGSSFRSDNTIQRISNSVRDIIDQCKFKDLEEIYSQHGFAELQKAFSRPVKQGTLKSACSSFIEFLEFLELNDDLPCDERKRMRLLGYFQKAKAGFSRGVKLDIATRREKLSESIHSGIVTNQTRNQEKRVSCLFQDYKITRMIRITNREALNTEKTQRVSHVS